MKAEIEQYLLTRPGWTSARFLSLRFHCPERKFRQARGKPGLLSEFAISSDKGYKHFTLATRREWTRYKYRLKKHAIGELMDARDMDKRRQSLRRGAPPVVCERDSNQTVMTWGDWAREVCGVKKECKL